MAITLNGNSNVSLLYSSGGRITGDFTNATLLSRAMFQTSTTDSTTGIYALPNGTSTAASWQATNNSDPTNASKVLIATNGTTDCQLVSGRNGSGTYLPLSFYTNGSQQMQLDAAGNLALGTGLSPSGWANFKVIESNNGAFFASQTTNTALYIGLNSYFNGSTFVYKTSAQATFYEQYNGTHLWFNSNNVTGTAGATWAPTQAMTLDASGNLFLNQGYLSLGNNGYIRADSAGWLQFQGGSSGSRFMNSSNASALMTLDTSGNLGIGTTIPSSIAKLAVSNTTTTDNNRIGMVASTYLSTPTYTGTFLAQGDSATTGTTCGLSNVNLGSLLFQNTNGALIWTNGGSPIIFGTLATARAQITSTGVFQINNLAGSGSRAVNADASGNLSAASDSSLKQEDKAASIPGLTEILKITPRAYKWLADIENRGDEAATEIGFFADEVAPIIPSAAPKCADGLYGFYDRSVTAALVKAIQELTTRLEALEAK